MDGLLQSAGNIFFTARWRSDNKQNIPNGFFNKYFKDRLTFYSMVKVTRFTLTVFNRFIYNCTLIMKASMI